MTPEELVTIEISQVCEETHWVTAPFRTPTPYVVLQVYGGRDMTFLNKQVGDKRHQLLSVEVWADTVLQAKALSRAIESQMLQTGAFNARPLAEGQDGGDEELGRFSFQQDFRLYIRREG